MAENASHLSTKLNALYDVIQGLTSTSSDEAFEAFGAFFAADCTVHLKSMGTHHKPAITRASVIEDIREMVKQVRIEKREILSSSVSSNASTLYCETSQRLNVMGEIVDSFFQTEIVTFNEEGLIKELKVYSCWSPIVRVVQDKTGEGPYADGERWEKWEGIVRKRIQMKMEKQAEVTVTAVCCD